MGMRKLAFSAALLIAAPMLVANHPVSPDTGFDVADYMVALTPDVASGAVSGRETIRLTTMRRLDALRFSGNALTISGATLNGEPVRVEADADGVVFRPDAPLAKGARVTLRFYYVGQPRGGIVVAPQGIYTSYSACEWMVCLQDSPGDKARFSLALTVPKGAVAAGPGSRAGEMRLADGRSVVRWETKRQWSPYLYGFAVGDFAEAGKGTLHYLNASGAPADLDTMFAETPAMVAFLSDKAGVKLPVARFTQVLVPGYEAQEAAGMSLIGRKALERDLAEPDTEWIVIHELSHQFWGNLVTCDSWRSFWLNEGFATFMPAAWKEHLYGRAAYDAELDVARARLNKVREAGFDKPLEWDGDYPSIGARRAVQYGKGALFLDHLRQELGDDAFWAGVKRYTRGHAGGTVTSADLQVALEKASGRDLSGDFERWVSGDQ